MSDYLLTAYVAVWNEPDPAARRAALARLWAPDGLHHTQTRRFRGLEELSARVTEAYDQFVGGSGLRFVSGEDLDTHHDVARFTWKMQPGNSEKVLAVGFDLLVLDDTGRITVDYQFNEPPPSVADLDQLAQRFLALATVTDREQLAKEIDDLYAPDARLVEPDGVHEGRAALTDVLATIGSELTDDHLLPRLTGNASAQHDALRFGWELVPAEAGGQPVATGLDFLIRDEQGLVRNHYRFSSTTDHRPPTSVNPVDRPLAGWQAASHGD